MLDIANTRFFQWTEKPIANDETIKNMVEGSPLVAVMENGVGKVSLGTGSDGELFEGFAFAGYVRPNAFPKIEKFEIDAENLAVVLAKKPVGEEVMVYIAGAKASVATSGSAAAGAPVFDAEANTITFAANDAGKEAKIVYRYDVTIAEARALAGDGYPGGFILSELGGTIGVIHQGQVATDQYDIASDWTAANPDIRVNADGQVAVGGTGAKIPNARVLMAPGVESAFLVLQLL